ncbi:hypothetical protein BLA29_008158 [Euroglyphus maynei]|uniref:6-pyruvoyltetrahydropterin synthase n=1 Tax=Euroglyphus maynei TaxID=6958 RepID=A0A1Y3B9D2_EURMA|nr:hypothetical protein BLA29_008158 [Euroglyphus maynei]
MSTNKPLVYLTRIEKFSTAHRLLNEKFDDEKNIKTFGKCMNIHGHNYTLEVTIKGPINEQTGMVMNIIDLKQIIMENVLNLLDHKYIDNDVEYFRTDENKSIISTSENICLFIWQQIVKHLPEPVQLHCIKLHETDKNIVKFYGEYL